MGNWDNFEEKNGNGFAFKCGLDPNIRELAYGYTLGKRDQKFLSLGASLSILVYNSLSKSRDKQNHLIISAPLGGKLVRWFDLLKNPKHGFEKLRIYIYNEDDLLNETTTLVFYNFKKLGEENPKLLPFIPVTFATFFTFKYDEMEVFGQTA